MIRWRSEHWVLINATVAAATAVNKTDSTEILPRRSVMQKQDKLAFIKALSAVHRRLVTSQKKKKKIPTVSAGRRSTPSGSVSRATNRLTGKRKANELARSGDSSEPANRRPATGAGSKSLAATTSARANKLLPAAGNTAIRGRGYVRGYVGR